MVDTLFTPAKGYCEIVPNRTRATLTGVMNRVLNANSTVHSDSWRAYINLPQYVPAVVQHDMVNHRYNFVDPVTGEHTQHRYSDSDLAGDTVDRKSRSVYEFMLGGATIFWMSKKQTVVALSSIEAEYIEYIPLSVAGHEAIWLRRLLESMNQKQTTSKRCVRDLEKQVKRQYGPPKS